ncbi:MAG: EF-hand domain-containing protein [Akkermansiaceae bacterium]|nr:EF-hand domain-containing protein [Akkermansiaceae bacterium]MCP5547548.1 EF-hand domain-containing protein [Akkermansiaceae bacterium]
MKTIPVSPMIAGLIFSSLAMAKPGDEGAPPRGGADAPKRPMVDAWKHADADRDGFLTKEEFSELGRVRNLADEKRDRLFTRLDKNGDGRIGRGELGAPPRGNKKPEKRALPRLWELDSDKSGSVSFEEFRVGKPFAKLPESRIEKVFERLDTNGDGVISPADRPDAPDSKKDVKRKKKVDKKAEKKADKKPGKKSGRKADAARHPQSILQSLDVDQDGAVSFEEYRKGPEVRNLGEDEQEDRFMKLDRNGDLKLTAQDFAQDGGAPEMQER